MDRFQSAQLTIIYNTFFDAILQADFTEEENIDLKLSNMTINKYVIHPFISIPKDVGISVTSLVSPKDSRHLEIFESCANNLEMVRNKTKEFAYMDTHANC